MAANGPRFRKAAEEVAVRLDRLLGALATADMIPGEAKARGQGLRVKGTNSSPFLRIVTGNLFRSYTEIKNPFHVHRTQWLGWFLKLVAGSAQTSEKGFPYAWFHEVKGPGGHRRPHLTRATMELQNGGYVQKYSLELAKLLAGIVKEAL